MAISDIIIPLTAKKDGPAATNLSPSRVFYLKGSDLVRMVPDADGGNAVVFVGTRGKAKKVELVESPNEFLAAQALSQGATANIYAAYNIASAQGATGSTPATALDITNYFTEVSSGNGLSVELPDPFVRRLCVIQNTTTGSINVFGRGTTSPINGSTAAYTLAAGKRKHFVAPTAATAGTTAGWKVATDA